MRQPFSRKTERLNCPRLSKASSQSPQVRWYSGPSSCLCSGPSLKIQHDAFSNPPLCRCPVIVLTTVLQYSEALAYVLLAFAVRWVMDHYPAVGLPFLTFFIAIAVTAWRVGVGPALAATVFSGFLAGYSFFPQPGLLTLASGQLLCGGNLYR